MPESHPILIADQWRDYELVDAGDGMKMERWGDVVLVRPDPQIIWPRRSAAPWTHWDGWYHRSEAGGGRWEFNRQLPEHWSVHYREWTFKIRPTGFKHTGLFPEQAVNWDWCHEKISRARSRHRPVSVLNLFGYTGAATIAAATAGASVCHVDAARSMVTWCRDNAALTGLTGAPIRFIADDCLKFVAREQRRGSRYDAIIMDPPSYGRGSSGEMWKLNEHLWSLLAACRTLLTPDPLFLLVNAYTTGMSPTIVKNLLDHLCGNLSGSITAGEVGLAITADAKILPCGVFGRWEA